MSLINDALKNIDERSSKDDTISAGSATGSFASGYAAEFNFNTQGSGNDERYSSRAFSFPFLCSIFVAAWSIALVHTLMAVDPNSIEKEGFLLAISDSSRTPISEVTQDIKIFDSIMLDDLASDSQDRSDNLSGFNLGQIRLQKNSYFNFDRSELFFAHKNFPELNQAEIKSVKVSVGEKEESKPLSLSESKRTSSDSYGKSSGSGTAKLEALKRNFYLAFKGDRLTLPKEDNAWYYLNKIKNTNPKSPFYMQGLAHLEYRYGELIDEGIEDGNISKSAAYLKRLVSISDNNDYIDQYHSKITAVINLQEDIHGQRLSIEKSDVPFANTIAIAKKHFSAGRLVDAELLLEKAITTHAAHEITLASVELWFDVLLKLSRFNHAQEIHETVQKYSWNSRWDDSYRQALLLSYQHDHDTALRFLSTKNSDDLSENALRFVAGLYQKESAYSSAKKIYKKLLNKFGDNSTYWLGYAVSSDALLEQHVALDAFKKTRAIGGLTPRLTSYVNDRIQALTEAQGFASIDAGDKDLFKLSSRKYKKGSSW